MKAKRDNVLSDVIFDDADEIFRDAVNAGLTPDASLSVAAWSDTHRVLSSTGSAEPGKWRTSRTPYLAAIMDALTVGSPYQKIVLMKGAQVGASEMAVNFLGYVADVSPGPALYLMPTLDAAKEFSKIRIDPLIAESEVLRVKVKESRSRDSGNTTLLKEFLGGYWAFTGANSAVGLRSKPVRFVVMDEIDAYPGSIEGEGDPVNLAYARTRTYGNRRKIFIASTPTVANESRIEKEFEETDKRFYFVPCPHCGHKQVLQWPRLKWTDNDPDTAHYVCESCEEKIYNHDKNEMLAAGEWRATQESKDPVTIGFHLSALYSPVGWYSWSDAVRDFLAAKEDSSLLRVFVNTVLGETWVDRADAPDWQLIYARREAYQIGVAPAPVVLLTAAADVQKDRIEILVQGWHKHGQYSVDYFQLLGDTTQNAVWEQLDAWLEKPIEHESGAEMRLRAFAIDSGYLTSKVYAWARRHRPDFVYVMKGVSSDLPVGQPRLVDFNFEGKRITNGARFWPIGVNPIKRELYTRLRLGLTEAGEYPQNYIHFPEYPPEFFRQITAESLQQTGKNQRKAWKKHYERNEALDLLVYNRALSIILGLDRLRDADWQTLENRVQREKQSAPEAQRLIRRPAPRRVISRGIDL
jgi:phage terminase large subunit GpA-like protein